MGRKTRNISQSKLADAIGVTYQQVQKYESGANRIGSSRLQQIAHVLQVSVAYFFEDLPGHVIEFADAQSPAHLFDFVSTSQGRALIEAFRRIENVELRRRIVHLVEEISSAEASD
jgi:transcriptional regulator with XRE-family HTH domain